MRSRRSDLGFLVSGIYAITLVFLFANSRACGIVWCGALLPYFVMPWVGIMNMLGWHVSLFGPIGPALFATAIAGLLNAGILYYLIKWISSRAV